MLYLRTNNKHAGTTLDQENFPSNVMGNWIGNYFWEYMDKRENIDHAGYLEKKGK